MMKNYSWALLLMLFVVGCGGDGSGDAASSEDKNDPATSEMTEEQMEMEPN